MSNTQRTASGDLKIPRVIVSDPGAVALQGAIDTLSLWQGSWYQDTAAGFPWLQNILGVRNISVTYAESLLTEALLTVPFVIDAEVEVFFDPLTRAFAYRFQAQLETNAVLSGGSSQAFHVNPGPV